MKKISRRDFLKLGWNTIQAAIISSTVSNFGKATNKKNTIHPNIVILICDAMSAHNLSLYGYPRKTTSNLEKWAERAFVYHNHHATGNYTTPGTSSLLTGLLPWTHRAVNQAAIVKKELLNHNIFHFLSNDYFKLAYTQNYWANYFLDQFSTDIDSLLPFSEFGVISGNIANLKLKKDLPIFHRAIEKMLYYGNSLFLSFLSDLYYSSGPSIEQTQNYPIGLPSTSIYHNLFTMEDLFNGLNKTIIDLSKQQSPFFSYFHIFPPHQPYKPNKDFYGMFDNDRYRFISKKDHPLAIGSSEEIRNQEHNNYDAFIANLDMEIGKLLDSLEKQGILDDTYFIIASDHGEMFERGMKGHGSPLMYEPLIKVPLLIMPPGNKTRRDFTELTSNIDLLPTLLNIAGQAIPDSCEGTPLPGFGGIENSHRSVFAMDAVESSAHKPFTKASYAIIKGQYKLIRYEGYPNKYKDYDEFYDLKEDAEEIQNKFSKPRLAKIAEGMKKELLDAIQLANEKLVAGG